MKKFFLILMISFLFSNPAFCKGFGDAVAKAVFDSTDTRTKEPEKKPQATVRIQKNKSGERVVEFKITPRGTVSGGQNIKEFIEPPLDVTKVRNYFKEKIIQDGKDEKLKIGKVRMSGYDYIVEIRDKDTGDLSEDNGFVRERITIDGRTGEIINEEQFTKYQVGY